MDNTVTAATTSTLLEELRREAFKWYYPRAFWIEQGIPRIIRHRSEFPVKIREAIQIAAVANAQESNPKQFCRTVERALKSLLVGIPVIDNTENENNEAAAAAKWDGLDSEVDTEEEVEVAIRFFPLVLRIQWYDVRVDADPINCLPLCLKALPFVPLLAELGAEFHLFEEEEQGGLIDGDFSCALEELVTNKKLLRREPRRDDEEFRRQLDEASLLVLVRLKENGLMRKGDIEKIYYVCDLVLEKPSRTEKRIRFFLDWDPTILKQWTRVSLLHIFLRQCEKYKHRVSKDEWWGRFQMIFELGMSHYPEEIGFLFYRVRNSTPTFQIACNVFGKEDVIKVFHEMILKSTMGRCNTIRTLVITAATNKRISLDSLYFLIRLDPIALMSADISR